MVDLRFLQLPHRPAIDTSVQTLGEPIRVASLSHLWEITRPIDSVPAAGVVFLPELASLMVLRRYSISGPGEQV